MGGAIAPWCDQRHDESWHIVGKSGFTIGRWWVGIVGGATDIAAISWSYWWVWQNWLSGIPYGREDGSPVHKRRRRSIEKRGWTTCPVVHVGE